MARQIRKGTRVVNLVYCSPYVKAGARGKVIAIGKKMKGFTELIIDYDNSDLVQSNPGSKGLPSAVCPGCINTSERCWNNLLQNVVREDEYKQEQKK